MDHRSLKLKHRTILFGKHDSMSIQHQSLVLCNKVIYHGNKGQIFHDIDQGRKVSTCSTPSEGAGTLGELENNTRRQQKRRGCDCK